VSEIPLNDANGKRIGSVEISPEAHDVKTGSDIFAKMIMSPEFEKTNTGWRLKYESLEWEAAKKVMEDKH